MKTEITIGFESERLDALEFALRKENATVHSRMEEALKQLYESAVPEPVREFIDSKLEPAPRTRRGNRAPREAPVQPIPPVTLPHLPAKDRGGG